MTGSQRTTTVTSGPASSQVTCHGRTGTAGRLDRSALSRTEKVRPVLNRVQQAVGPPCLKRYCAGAMLLFSRNKLSGSYRCLTSTSLGRFSPKAVRTSSPAAVSSWPLKFR
jgi:hypothetical protein